MNDPLIIAHRGVPGEQLEHTAESYQLAIEQGCDVIEPDVVPSADGVLVAMHDAELSHTTDVAERPEFSDRRRTLQLDGKDVDGWFVHDFSLAELKTLHVRERWPELRPQNAHLTGEILTLDEAIEIARGGGVGLMFELKQVADFLREGSDVGALALETLARHDLNRPDAAVQVMIESFEVTILRRLRPLTALPLAQLVDAKGAPADLTATGDRTSYAEMITPEGLREVATYVDWLAVRTDLVIGRDAAGNRLPPTSLVDDARAAGIDRVIVYTLRDENRFLPADLRIGAEPGARGNVRDDYLGYFDAGVGGLFSDYTASAVTAREAWWAARR